MLVQVAEALRIIEIPEGEWKDRIGLSKEFWK